MGDGEGEDRGVAVGMELEDFFFYGFIVFLDRFAKEDDLVRLLKIVLPRRPEVRRMHTGDDIDAPHEAFFEKLPADVLGLLLRLTGDVDEDHSCYDVIIAGSK